MIHDVILVGSGPGAAGAALRLAGQGTVLVLDVGHRPERMGEALDADQFALKREGRADPGLLLGKDFESLHNLHRDYLSPKLKPPLLRFITRDWQKLSPLLGDGFDPVLSHARGGLANAWGAGAYRFTARELRRFPITLADLEPWYKAVEAHIGVCGGEDGLSSWLGGSDGLLPAPDPGRIGQRILAKSSRYRDWLKGRGLTIGRPRMALLTREHRGRPAYRGDGMEFFRPCLESIYNPSFTFDELERSGAIEMRSGHLVERFRELPDGHVEVSGRDLGSGACFAVRARRLVLAAGAVNSARIVLASQSADVTLPLRDNPISYVPMVDLGALGSAPDARTLPLQCNLLYDGPLWEEPVQASLYGVSAPLWNDLAFTFPLAARGTMAAVRHVLPALLIVQLFYPDCGSPRGSLRLTPDGSLRATYRGPARGRIERHLLRSFLRLGCLGHSILCQYPIPGNSFHYAGTLPMSAKPEPFECGVEGSLGGRGHVYLADASGFPELPSKNLTLTIMANAMRVADRLLAGMDRG